MALSSCSPHTRLPLLILLPLCAASALSPQTTSAPSSIATVTVDFARPEKAVKSMSGILHGVSATEPADDAVKPLRPNLWRFGRLGIYDRVAGFGARFELVLSDTWGYGRSRPGPWEDYGKWGEHVRKTAQESKPRRVMWDVWNEPDWPTFWKGTRDQFFETYRRAYRILREELGAEVMIGGPSITKFDRDFLFAFLEYCRLNNLEVNFLSWHELQTDKVVPEVADHLADARAHFLQNPVYSTLKLREIHINEIVGPSAQYRPGEILGYFYYLETGKADGASKACWPDSKKGSNCSNNTIDGILNPGTYQPRAAWWAYKAYADGVESRVESESTDLRVVALGSSRSERVQEAQLLLGYLDYKESPAFALVAVHLRNLSRLGFKDGQKLRIMFKRIPDSGEAPAPELETVKEEIVTVKDGFVRTVITDFGLHEGYLLTIGRASE